MSVAIDGFHLTALTGLLDQWRADHSDELGAPPSAAIADTMGDTLARLAVLDTADRLELLTYLTAYIGPQAMDEAIAHLDNWAPTAAAR